MSNRATALLAVVLLVLLVTAPYLFAAGQDSGVVFGGFLLNPRDGNSYLAKMQEGWRGDWLFTLPYTAEPGPGVPLFTFYLALGHLSRLTGLPAPWVFHLARAACAVGLVFALRGLFTRLFPRLPRARRWALLLAVFGSGLGWTAALLGALPSDLWVAEGYPFLASYANPHFPLGLALMAWLFSRLIDDYEDQPRRLRNLLVSFGLGFLLAVVMPFGLAAVAAAALAFFAWQSLETRRFQPLPLLAAFGGGGLLLVYQYGLVLAHPALAVWNAQNVTPSPALWDALRSFSPALPAGLVAAPALARRKTSPADKLLLCWFLVGLTLIYLPLNLQRRFLVGYFIPCAAMAGWCADVLWRKRGILRRLPAVLLLLSIPTNLLILASGFFGAASREPLVYLSQNEAAVLSWVSANTPNGALVLAGEEMGMYIPARTGRRVIYGHPYETAHAGQELEAVQRFYQGEMSATEAGAFLAGRGIDYVLVGPRELSYGSPALPAGLSLVDESGPVRLYRVRSGE